VELLVVNGSACPSTNCPRVIANGAGLANTSVGFVDLFFCDAPAASGEELKLGDQQNGECPPSRLSYQSRHDGPRSCRDPGRHLCTV